MTDTLQRLADRADIQDLLWRYCRGVDRGDVDLIKSVYHPGATDNHGVFQGDGFDFAEFIVPLLRSMCVATQHQLSNMLIDIDGDTASAESYFVAYHHQRPDGVDELMQFGGRYLDRLERRDGRWAIVDRVVVMDWTTTTPLNEDKQLASAFRASI